MGHLFKHTCSQHSFNYTFICSLPDFSDDEFQALLWSEDGLFGQDKILKSVDGTMLPKKALGWQFRKGVYHFCVTNIGGVIVWHSLPSHLHFTVEVCPWLFLFLGANFVCKPPLLCYGGALVNAWPDFQAFCQRWLLITLIFTFFSGANLSMLL